MIKKHQERLQKWQAMLNSVNKGSFYSSQAQQQMSGPSGGQQYNPHAVPPGPYTGSGGMPGQTHMGLSSSAMSGGQFSQTLPQQSPHMMMSRQGPTPISSSLPHTIPRDPYSTWNKACLILVSHCQDPNAGLLVNLYYCNYFYLLYIYMIRLY